MLKKYLKLILLTLLLTSTYFGVKFYLNQPEIEGFNNAIAENQAFKVCTLIYNGKEDGEYNNSRIVIHRYSGPHSKLYSVDRFFKDYPNDNVKVNSVNDNSVIFSMSKDGRYYVIKDYRPANELNYFIVTSHPIVSTENQNYDTSIYLIQHLSDKKLNKLFSKYCSTENSLKKNKYQETEN